MSCFAITEHFENHTDETHYKRTVTINENIEEVCMTPSCLYLMQIGAQYVEDGVEDDQPTCWMCSHSTMAAQGYVYCTLCSTKEKFVYYKKK